MTGLIKAGLRSAIPLPVRMRLAAWLTRQQWLPVGDHMATGLIRDLLSEDPKFFHKFMWANHLMDYARWYDSEDELFSLEQMQPSRIELFRDLVSVLSEQKIEQAAIRSVFEAGCSQGYLLRYLETHVFPGCLDLQGIDIDTTAIERGRRFLGRVGSRVKLAAGDMEDLDRLVGRQTFDITIAAGVLSYLNEEDAAQMVSRLLDRTSKVLVLAGLACVERNNNRLSRSELSPGHSGQWIHNFEELVARAGGRVVRTRWEGAKQYNLQTISFVFAVPAQAESMS